MSHRFLSGLIEGFYGPQWSWEERRGWSSFLKEQGQQFYLYAPKGDRHLREEWLTQWPAETLREMERLRQQTDGDGIDFGFGFSPYEIHLRWDTATRRQLEKRLAELRPLEPEILGLLFDDMRGAERSMGQIQTEIAHVVADHLPDTRIVVCPTYYTPDPILKALFGWEPEGYLEELGKGIDPSIDIFWTGPRVCSEVYPEDHLIDTAKRLRRKPFIWDNYPVNDGARMAPFLHLLPAAAGRPLRPETVTSGFGINPMNQPWLSRIPFAAQAAQWRSDLLLSPEEALSAGLEVLDHPELAQLIRRDLTLFQERGIGAAGTVSTVFDDWERGILRSPHFSGLTPEEQSELREESAAFARKLPTALTEREREVLASEYGAVDHPAAEEIVGWLQGRYAFRSLS